MVLRKETLRAINNQRVRISLAYHLGKTEQWISRLIEQNKHNGLLTTVAALKVIKEETGLDESEILTEAETEARAAKVIA